MLREHLAWAIAVVADQTGDVPEGVPAIITPRQVLVLERDGQGWQLIPVGGLGPVMVVRAVDDGRIGADQHQVIRRGGPGHLGEVPVADGKAPRQVPVAWNISLPVPQPMGLIRRAGHPRLVSVVGVIGGRIRSVGRPRPVGAGEPAEVVVERMVLLHDDYHVVNRSSHDPPPRNALRTMTLSSKRRGAGGAAAG